MGGVGGEEVEGEVGVFDEELAAGDVAEVGVFSDEEGEFFGGIGFVLVGICCVFAEAEGQGED